MISRVDTQYLSLLDHILRRGYKLPPARQQDTGTIQINSGAWQCDIRNEFPLLTTKKMDIANIITELLWFLKGDTNIKYLVDNGCSIWNSDAHKYYLRKGGKLSLPKFIDEVKNSTPYMRGNQPFWSQDDYVYGDLGPVYGAQWRGNNRHVDQIHRLITEINTAVETGVYNRRLMVNAWNADEISDMALPPCHYGFQIILEPIPTSEQTRTIGSPKYYLNLKWHQRSVDTFLGLPYNIASYAILAKMLAAMTNTIARDVIGDLSCIHIYDNHVDAVKTQLTRKGNASPELVLNPKVDWRGIGKRLDFNAIVHSDFILKGYNPDPRIKANIVT